MTKAALKELILWVRPEFNKLRYFVDASSGSTSKISKSTSISIMSYENSDEVFLSVDSMQKIESGIISNGKLCSLSLHVSNCRKVHQFRKLALNFSEYTQKQIVIQAAGKHGRHLTMKVSSRLNEVSCYLKKRACMKLEGCQV